MFFKMMILTIGVRLKFSVYITNPYFGFREFGGRGGAVMGQLVFKESLKKLTHTFIFIN